MAENDPLLETRNTVKRSVRSLLLGSVLVILLIAASAGAYAWYSLPASCEVASVEDASTLLVSQMMLYDDVYASAASGTRTSIEYPVTVMQQILMDTQAVEVPTCMRKAKGELINYMGDVIRAFKSFQAEDPNDTIQSLLNSSYTHVRAFRIELESVKQCAPYCMPWR